MADLGDKENIANGLSARVGSKRLSLSPRKPARKTRSKSIGPGGLEESALKESSGNRRKSAFIPAVKSILSSNDDDERKRREARRKSLARRRVSFAPEATLHTWDVVEYLRDATSSSASSDATRRASAISQGTTATSPARDPESSEPPSTPPEQVEDVQPDVGSSPANQRDLHQKRNRRRSSGIPPMNFNNPDDVFSSSPASEDAGSPSRFEATVGEMNEVDAPSDSDESEILHDNSQSSEMLDAALRQAAAHAGTQRLDLDNEDLSTITPEDDVTASFKPWTRQSGDDGANSPDHEDPFAVTQAQSPTSSNGDEEMSMDITKAIGAIVSQAEPSSPASDDMSMELTMPLGSIHNANGQENLNRRKSLKRRMSIVDASQGSPAERPKSRRTSLRQRTAHDDISAVDDQTMDLTLAIGAISSQAASSEEQDIHKRNGTESVADDETMDLTVAVGRIQSVIQVVPNEISGYGEPDTDEDMSMEFTKVVGHGIKQLAKPVASRGKAHAVLAIPPTNPGTPRASRSPEKSPNRPVPPVSTSRSSTAPKQPIIASTIQSAERVSQRLSLATPVKSGKQEQSGGDEMSPFIRSANPRQMPDGNTPTGQARNAPLHIPADPIAAPLLNRRRSSLTAMHFSPLAVSRDEPTLRSTAILSNNIKLLSTPRKQTLASPSKRGLTPRGSQTPQHSTTPQRTTPTPKKFTPRKSASPKKRVAFGEDSTNVDADADIAVRGEEEEVERISLQDFLELTRIRFMDLSTTKRRHTAAPAAFHDREVEDQEESLDRYVAAGACTLPEFELYQHACHEMKKYISDGRHFVRTMEANVMEENPMLFSEYLTAPSDQRAIMDNQFKNLKTNARLEARGEWYGWRTNLLHDLQAGLLATMDAFRKDEMALDAQESLLDAVLPPLTETQESLTAENQDLQRRHDELNSCDREELEDARQQLVGLDSELAAKRKLVADLQLELADKDACIRAIKDRKVECIQETREAERLREEFRGWSTTEVSNLKAKVTALEKTHGWSVSSASTDAITMTHQSDLELYFQPSAFSNGQSKQNAPISLTYVGDSATPHPRPLTTSKRFFLQLIRAYLHCISQPQTRVIDLLNVVRNAWAAALAVSEGVRWLDLDHITEETILSDERLAITTSMLLPALQTKVRLTFEIGVSMGPEGVETNVDARAEVVYGEKYSEDKMGAFLRDFIGDKVLEEGRMGAWADAVVDLKERLKATGRKGERA